MGIPVDRYLVPDGPPVVPPGFTTVSHALVRGVPEALRLDADFDLLLQAPTGQAVRWRDAEPTLLILTGDDDALPAAPAASTSDAASRLPLRLVLRRAGLFVATVPWAVGLRRPLPDDGGASAIELLLLDCRLHAGTLCGAGDFGSILRFAWKRIDRDDDLFVLPALPPRVAERFVGQVQSRLGLPGGVDDA